MLTSTYAPLRLSQKTSWYPKVGQGQCIPGKENEWRSGGSCETPRSSGLWLRVLPPSRCRIPGMRARMGGCWHATPEDAFCQFYECCWTTPNLRSHKIRGFRCSRIALSRLAFCASCLAKRLTKIVKDWLTGWQDCHPFRCPWVMSRRKLPGAPSDPKFRRQFATWQV